MKHISEFVRQCTDALSGDPEVQLEIEQELRDHLECRAAEEQSNGMSEEASEELAIKAFGDAPEISESLYDTNLYRMKLHAKIRLFIKVAAIPALLVALYFSFDYRNMILNWDIDELYFINYPTWNSQNNLSTEQKLIVYGDTSAPNRADEQRAISEHWPENKVFKANYITALMCELGLPKTKATPNYILTELRKAKSVDPQNAYYNYMTAAVLLKTAVDMEPKTIKLPGKRKYKIKKDIILKDRKQFDRAMKEIKTGLKKPYCREYAMELSLIRANITCDNSKTMRDQLRRLSILGSTLLPFLNQYRDIGRILPYYARLQAKAGNKKEAEFYLNAWKPYVQQLNNGADTLIGILVANAIIGIQQKQVPEIYRMLGKPHKAKWADKELKIATDIINNWKKTRKTSWITFDNGKLLNHKGGIFASLMLPQLGEKITDGMLAPERNLNYIMLEKIVVATMSLVGLAIIVIILIFMGWKYWRGERSFIFVPSLKEFTKIVGGGLIAPLIVYFIITRVPILSGRDYNIFYNLERFTIQALFFIFGIPVAMVLAVSGFVRHRCDKTGIGIPRKSKWICRVLILNIIVITGLTCYLNFIIFQNAARSYHKLLDHSIPIVVTIAAIALGIIIVPMFRLMFMKKKYSRYKLTLYVNLISPIILMMLMVSIIVRPYLDRGRNPSGESRQMCFHRNGFNFSRKSGNRKIKNQT